MSRGKIIGVPPKTQLYAVVRHEHEWRVWMGVDDMQRPYERWTGVYLMCRDDGTVLKVRANRDGSEDIVRIM